jgi:protein disulfide-isomerase A1
MILDIYDIVVPSEYEGGRTEPEIVSWINKKTGPSAKELKTLDDLTAAEEANDSFVVGYFESLDSAAAKSFLKLADANDLHVFTITSSNDIKAKLELKGDTIVVLKDFDDLRNDLVVDSTYDSAKATEFIVSSSTPLIQTFSDASSKKIFGSPIKVSYDY